MTFSTEWEQLYQDNTHLSIWPWSDMVSYVMRYARPLNKSCRVLELGCGAGANIPLFKHLGVQYHAMEGSATIVKMLTGQFPEYSSTIKVGDFTKELPFDGEFDLIVDRASLPHNTTSSIKECMKLVKSRLAPHGKFIGIDWFSTDHSDYPKGKPAGDAYTKTAFSDGPFQGVGAVHFFDKNHLVEILEGFNISHLEHKHLSTEIPENELVIATWNFLATKE